MCGIVGQLTRSVPDRDLLARMAAAIAHRGPDDHGVWSDPDAGIGLAHRRLAIVDLSPHGRQPMISADGRWVLCYNGEIYNHAAIRAELDAAGQAPEGGWRGHSDTETLLQAIAGWGLAATLERAVGMFAFALWDRTERRLQLVRDRFGEKPLYYGWIGHDFVFASELKAIRIHPRFDGQIDRTALRHYAARTYIPAPWSIYRRLFKLLPGTVLTLDALGEPFDSPPVEGGRGPVRSERYWSYPAVVGAGRAEPYGDRAEALAALEGALAQSIGGQGIADVPVGAFLSGGIDSSTVVALYKKYGRGEVATYTIGFHEAGFDEATPARAVAAHLGTRHHEHYVTVDEARSVIPDLPDIYDEPFADSSQIPTYLVSRFARREVTVALSGDGGDELFGGYNRHIVAPDLWRRLSRVPAPLRSLAATPLAAIPSSWWQAGGALLPGGHQPHFGAKLNKALRLAGSARRFDDVYAGFLDEWALEPSPVLGAGDPLALPEIDPSWSDAERMMTIDALTYLPDDIMTKVDRAAMAVSLETRAPFLDHRVAAVAARIPPAMKIHHGQGKQILRELLARELPPKLFQRPKAGFGIPVGEWIKGPLRDWAEDLLDPAAMAAAGYFDAGIVGRRWADHCSGQRDSTPALWAVLMFEAWRRRSLFQSDGFI